MVKIRQLTVIAATSAGAMTIALPRIAHAETEYYFVSPTGNIGCMMGNLLNGGVMCDVKHYTYARQHQSFGAITCDSEQTRMTCTDTDTGHYFRVSSDSYQLG